jgi:Tfp pilus assembly protein PilF
MVGELRVQLGESPVSVGQFVAPLPPETRASLEAFKAMGLAWKVEDEKGIAAALPIWQRAVERDPGLAEAWYRIGVIYRDLGQEERAREFLTKAFKEREHAGPRDQFAIAGLYYGFATGEINKSIDIYRRWIDTYPTDVRAHAGFGSLLGDVCRYAEGIAQFREAVRLSPDNVIAHEDLVELLVANGAFDQARQEYNHMLQLKLDDDSPHVFMYAVAFLERDAAEMSRQVAWFQDKSEFQHEILAQQADAEAYRGHLQQARALTEQAVRSAERANDAEQAAAWQLNSAWREMLFGNSEEAHAQAMHALTLAAKSREGAAVAAIVLARTGDPSAAQAIAEDLGKRYPLHDTTQSYWLPCIRAQIALAARDPTSALKQLRVAQPYDNLFLQIFNSAHMPSVVLRAEAYAAMGQPAAAAKEWDSISRLPGIVQLSATAPIARLGLARAYAQMTQSTRNSSPADQATAHAKAVHAYKAFLDQWKEADPERIPVLKQAQAELGALQR